MISCSRLVNINVFLRLQDILNVLRTNAVSISVSKFIDSARDFFSCAFCSYTCNRPDKLRVHVMGVHNNDKPFPCEFCEKSFKQRDKLTRHTSTVHYKDKPFSCEYCQQVCFNGENDEEAVIDGAEVG